MWTLPNLPMGRRDRRRAAATDAGCRGCHRPNLALEHYRDIRALAAGSRIVRPGFDSYSSDADNTREMHVVHYAFAGASPTLRFPHSNRRSTRSP